MRLGRPIRGGWQPLNFDMAMISIKLDEVSTYRFGSQQVALRFSANGQLTIRSSYRPGTIGIWRPDSGHEFRLMKTCFDDQWRSIAVAERLQPGAKVVFGMGNERLAVEVLSIVGKDVCVLLGVEELEPRIA